MLIFLASAAAATPFAGAALPPIVVTSYRVRVREARTPLETRHAAPGERFRVATSDPQDPLDIGVAGTEFYGRARSEKGSVLSEQFAVQPDGFFALRDRYTELVDSVLGRARSGRPFVPARVGGLPALRADVALPDNKCAALPPRIARVWISSETFLPLRVEERIRSTGRVQQGATYTYDQINAPVANKLFLPPPLAARPYRATSRFHRTSVAAAAAKLPYTPQMPSLLPPGFDLAVSGWAPRSGDTGAEASIPPSPWLFGASFRRGQERVDITQRADGRDWPDDPFGGECQELRTEQVKINGAAATYGIGPTISPHLYWRASKVRYTVSGPFSRDDLVAIASSLQPITP